MGVAGAGKSTVGAALAARLGVPFLEGDSLHPPDNLAKLAAGGALHDADREPWLEAIAAWIAARHAEAGGGVATCSALRRVYRDRLRSAGPLRLVFLTGRPPIIAARLDARRGHFAPASLLASQLATLEPPDPDEQAIVADVEWSTPEQVAAIVAGLLRTGPD